MTITEAKEIYDRMTPHARDNNPVADALKAMIELAEKQQAKIDFEIKDGKERLLVFGYSKGLNGSNLTTADLLKESLMIEVQCRLERLRK